MHKKSYLCLLYHVIIFIKQKIKKIESYIKIDFKVIVMDNCQIRAVGTKSSIEDIDPELAAEWRIADSRQENENRFQKTAKDRWSLIRLVSRIGIGITKKHASDGSWIIDRDVHMVNKKSRIYERDNFNQRFNVKIVYYRDDNVILL